MKSVARRISDRQVLHLIKMSLEVPVEETDEKGGRSERHATRTKAAARRKAEWPRRYWRICIPPVHSGLEAVGPRGAAASSHCQLCGRLRDLHAWPSRGGDGGDAAHDGQAEIGGERTEDAAVSPAGRYVHVSGVHVWSSLFASDGRVLCGASTGTEKGPEAVP